MTPSRDDDLDRLLRSAPPHDASADACPDAETLGAWREEGLSSAERTALESHAAGCPRCQMHLAAMAKMELDAAPSKSPAWRLWPWLVPLTASAAAALWFIAQPPGASAPSVPVPEAHIAPAAPPERDERAVERSADRTAPAAPPLAQAAPARQEARRDETTAARVAGAAANTEPTAAAPLSAVGAGAGDAAVAERALEGKEVAIDVDGVKAERAPDGTVSWDTRASGLEGRITAGASPAPPIIWLVGRGGLVLLSVDGHTWRKLPFPEPLDLVRVEPTSATAALVVTADGRALATSDGGRTWVRR